MRCTQRLEIANTLLMIMKCLKIVLKLGTIVQLTKIIPKLATTLLSPPLPPIINAFINILPHKLEIAVPKSAQI